MRPLADILKTKNHTGNTGNTGKSANADGKRKTFLYVETMALQESREPSPSGSSPLCVQKSLEEILSCVPPRETRKDQTGETSNPTPIVQPCPPNAKVSENPVNLEPADGKTPSSDQEEHRTERAAIREYSGGQSRDQAEQGAVEETGPCYMCHGGRFWVSTYGVIVCERCHPPATPQMVARTLAIGIDRTRAA